MVKHVVVINDLSAERDGPSTIALATVRALRAKGVGVSYVCGDQGDNAALKALGVSVHALGGTEIRQSNPALAAVKGLFNADASRLLSRLIRDIDTDQTIYHVHNWSKILSPSIFLSLRSVMPRVIITTHDYFLACPNGGFFNYKTQKMCDRIPLSAGCICTNCDRRSYLEKAWRLARDVARRGLLNLGQSSGSILAVHDGMIPHLVRGGIAREAIKVLRNPVKPWSPVRIEAERNKMFVFVGRLDADKGPDLLAQAATQAGVPLTLIGDGQLRASLARDYPNVTIAGFKTRQELAPIVRNARALVVPTGSRETFSLVAFEALASGIPVVMSKFAATVDEIVDQRVGLACDPYSADGLASILKTLAEDDDEVKTMSQRAFDLRDVLTLSEAAWSDKLIDIYAQKLSSQGVVTEPDAPVELPNQYHA